MWLATPLDVNELSASAIIRGTKPSCETGWSCHLFNDNYNQFNEFVLNRVVTVALLNN